MIIRIIVVNQEKRPKIFFEPIDAPMPMPNPPTIPPITVPIPGQIIEPAAAPALAPIHPPPTLAAFETVFSANSFPEILPRQSLIVSGIVGRVCLSQMFTPSLTRIKAM